MAESSHFCLLRVVSISCWASSAGVRVRWGEGAVAAHGTVRLESVDLAPLEAAGRPRLEAAETIACDALCLGYGLIASAELARALGCALRHDPRHLGSPAIVAAERR